MRFGLVLASTALALSPILLSADIADANGAADLTALSLAELADLEVTSVTKRGGRLGDTPAAIHVITAKELRRSGVKTLVDALRFVPGVQVARVDGNKWAVGIRGFASRLARSQLVLIDGRSVYDPLFAGTYWEDQDTLLEDVDRIEVVRGPGGTLWGANAVNGVVNIVTRHSRETQGGMVRAMAGNEERAALSARYGGAIGASGSFRVYGKGFKRDGGFHPQGPEFDDWHMLRGGFRSDFDLRPDETLTVQGDLYNGRAGARSTITAFQPPYSRVAFGDSRLSGGNLLSRWRRNIGGAGELAVQAYYDRTSRDELTFGEDRNTFDLAAEYQLPLLGQEILWGVGYRRSAGQTRGLESLSFVPARRADNLLSAFVQDDVSLVPERLRLAFGTKVERNDYSGFEFQPSARLLFTRGGAHTFWAAVTRAVRTPTRIEHDLQLTASTSANTPVFARLLGNPDFEAERVYAYEGGYRLQRSDGWMVEAATFYNRYPNLLSVEPGAPFAQGSRFVLPFGFGNGLRARVMGLELESDVRVSSRFRIHGGYAYLNMDLSTRPSSHDTTSVAAEGASPRHMGYVRSSLTLRDDVDFDVNLRVVDKLPSQSVPRYAALDARVAWRLRAELELGFVGQNLLRAHHLEFGGGPTAVEVDRSLFAEVQWRW
jgi:iron complex outermembrane recepter protein